MPFNLPLPKQWAQHWKVKIFDNEPAYEPPHVSFVSGKDIWRLDLRTQKFLDRSPKPRLVPSGLLDFVLERIEQIRAAWDNLHPENPIDSDDDADDD